MATKIKEANDWIDDFNENHPGTFVDLSEEEEEALCGWIRDIQNQAIQADRALWPLEQQVEFFKRMSPEERAAFVNTAPGIPPGITHVGGSMLDNTK